MEKQKPHYELKKFKKLFSDSKTRLITKTAQQGAATMGYMDEADILSVIKRLGPDYFYKSMTSYQNPKLWQDVYRYQDDEDRSLYIKLQISIDGKKSVLIQMKKDEGKDE
jgi:motility quorum-sensing regulator/GCU-specific mRNA interferase toxin